MPPPAVDLGQGVTASKRHCVASPITRSDPRIPAPVVAFGAPEAVLEVSQALMLAEAPLVGVGAALFGGDRPPQPR
jgi:hypothetical protein